jgi:hypothetical protein
MRGTHIQENRKIPKTGAKIAQRAYLRCKHDKTIHSYKEAMRHPVNNRRGHSTYCLRQFQWGFHDLVSNTFII